MIIVILTAAVYLYLYTYDYNKLKPLVTQEVEDATGRKLHLGGDFDLKFGLWPELVVTDVALANASWGSQPQMLEIETLQARVGLLPLLIKKVDVQFIHLDGVRVLLETGPDSETNWGLFSDGDPSNSPPAFKPTAIELDRLKIENLQFTSRGTGKEPPTQLAISHLEINRLGNSDELTLTLRADYNGLPTTLSGKTGLVDALLGHRRFPLQLSGNLADLAVNVNGSIDDVLQLQGIDVDARLSGNNLATLGPALEFKLPETKSFDVAGHLKGSTESLGLEINGNLSGDSISIAINGSVANLIDISGVDLNLKSSGKNLAVLRPIVGEGIPSTREFEIQGRLTGSTRVLEMNNARAAAKVGSLDFTANGAVKNILSLDGMDLECKLTGKNLAEFGKVIDVELPATDEFEIQGHLTGSTDVLPLHKARGKGRRGSLNLSVAGAVKDLYTLEGMDLQSRLTGKNLAEFGEVIEVELPATDDFEIQGHLSGSTEALALQAAQGSARRGSMELSLTGAVQDLLTLGGMDLRPRLSGKELAEIGPLFNKEIPGLGPFNVDFKLTGSAKAITLDEVSAVIDKSDFTGRAKVEFAKRPKVTVRLDSSSVDFSTLMDSLERDERKSSEKSRQKGRFFTDDPLPLDVLETFDADILLKAENLHARNAHFESGHLKLKIEDSELKNGDFEAVYKETIISGGLVIDFGSPSRIATNWLIQNFDLGGFLKEIEVSNKVVATVDIATHLHSRGDSVRSLVANLNGSIGAVMGEGYLTEYLDMLSAGLTDKVIKFWKIPGDVGRQINCAVVQFDIESGIATSRAFVFNSRAGVLKGHGRINLDTEKINYLLVPTPRHPDLSYMTNLRVSGTLMDPEVTPDKASVALKGSTALSALVIGPLGLLAPFVRLGAKNEHTCDVESIGELGLSKSAAE